ncbi:MAG: helix-turn-helix domain-containing protein [bacterium]
MIPGFNNLTYFEVLDLSPESGHKEVQQAYYRVRAAFSKNALATYSLYTASEREKILRLVEEAYHTLIDEKAREEYEQRLKKEKRLQRSRQATQEFLPLTPSKPEPREADSLSYPAEGTVEEEMPAEEAGDAETVLEGHPPEQAEQPPSGISYADEAVPEKEAQEEEEEKPGAEAELEHPEPEPAEPAMPEGEEKTVLKEERQDISAPASGPEKEGAAPPAPAEEAEETGRDSGGLVGEQQPGRHLTIREARAARSRGENIIMEGSIKSRVSDVPEQTFTNPYPSAQEEHEEGPLPASTEVKEGVDKEGTPVEAGAFEDTVYNLPQPKKASTPLDHLDTAYSGAYLRQVRESQGFDMYKTWEVTKIRKPILEAIEEENYQKLPADVFLKGMLLIYARFLGIADPEAVVKGYMERLVAARDWMD